MFFFVKMSIIHLGLVEISDKHYMVFSEIFKMKTKTYDIILQKM